MKKFVFWILTILWIWLSFCNADYVIYNESDIPADCELSFFSYRVPYGFSSYNSNYNCLYILDTDTPIYIVNSSNTVSFWSFTNLYHKLVCSADSVFYFNNEHYSNWFGADFRGCNITFQGGWSGGWNEGWNEGWNGGWNGSSPTPYNWNIVESIEGANVVLSDSAIASWIGEPMFFWYWQLLNVAITFFPVILVVSMFWLIYSYLKNLWNKNSLESKKSLDN